MSHRCGGSRLFPNVHEFTGPGKLVRFSIPNFFYLLLNGPNPTRQLLFTNNNILVPLTVSLWIFCCVASFCDLQVLHLDRTINCSLHTAFWFHERQTLGRTHSGLFELNVSIPCVLQLQYQQLMVLPSTSEIQQRTTSNAYIIL